MSTLKKIITLIFVLLLLVLAIAISSLNADSVLLKLYWYELNWPLGFTLLLFSCFGVLFGLLLGWLFWTWPANKQKTYWKREYFKLKQENEANKPSTVDELSANSLVESQVKIP